MQGLDAKLVRRCQDGDARAWEDLVKRFSGSLLNMAYRFTGSYAVAEELTQDIFLRLYENLPKYRPETGSLGSWVLRVGRNLVIDHYRSHKREKNVAGSEELETLDFKMDSKTVNPFESVYLREKADSIQLGLRAISPELREAVVLRDLEGLAYQEIAEVLSIPEGTVKSRINRGRIELAKVLKKDSLRR